MSTRSTASGTISFGLVTVPFKLYTAATAEGVSFNQITPAGNRVKQLLADTVTGSFVDRAALLKGYEYSKGQWVTFTAEELKTMEAPKTDTAEILEFVPADSVDVVNIEKNYYMGPGKGGTKAYGLLAATMKRLGKVAVARYTTRGREQLVVIRPYRGGLMMSYVYYANEVRSFEDASGSVETQFSDEEVAMAEQLVARYEAPSFNVAQYKDEYTSRVEAAVAAKIAGQDVPVAKVVSSDPLMDLFAALKKSLEVKPTTTTVSP